MKRTPNQGSFTDKNQPVSQDRCNKCSTHHKDERRVPSSGNIEEIEDTGGIDDVRECKPGAEDDPDKER